MAAMKTVVENCILSVGIIKSKRELDSQTIELGSFDG